jgi:hypothetical protein
MEKNPMKNLVITFAAIFIVFMALRPAAASWRLILGKPYEACDRGATLMRGIFVITFAAAVALMSPLPASTQEVAPGWRATGHWQCGPVRILSSEAANGSAGLDFFVTGAWFDNHFTLIRDQLYYNGTPCMAVGYPWPLRPPQRQVKNEDDIK